MGKPEHDSDDVPVSTLERYVRRLCPELILYISEEEYAGESIEAQLQSAGWKGPEILEAMAKWEQLRSKETRRTWKKRALVVAMTLLLPAAGIVLQGAR